MAKFSGRLRRYSRRIHRDLSFFFTGVIVVYAVSGIAMNHKSTFNSEYSVRRHSVQVSNVPAQEQIDPEWVKEHLLRPWGEEKGYTKHYFPRPGVLKVFIKGGSSIVLNIQTGKGEYEALKRRPLLSSVNKLHYNPGKWWTTFSDVFAVSLILIALTGCLMLKGKYGIWGWGGIELLAGLLFPLAFLFFF